MNDENQVLDQKISCEKCGADVEFKPGSTALTCPYCDHEMKFEVAEAHIEEIDFHSFLREKADQEEAMEIVTVRCAGCGADTSLDPNVTSDTCPYCGTSLVVTNRHTQKVITPKSLLPFHIDQKAAFASFRQWLQKLWFAPDDLKRFAASESKLKGMYMPYWTFDADTNSHYRGQRGEDYYVSETYTTTENGKTVTKTRRVRKTRWYNVSGRVFLSFDDVLVLASNSLPRKYADALEPWDLVNLTPYDPKFLRGFRTETYQVSLEEGFDFAKNAMDTTIRAAVRRDIGGDHQRINWLQTQHHNITFKHILLPVWISAYRYREKVYNFMINARTGEVQGERPWSWIKISLAVLSVLITIAILYAIFYLFLK